MLRLVAYLHATRPRYLAWKRCVKCVPLQGLMVDEVDNVLATLGRHGRDLPTADTLPVELVARTLQFVPPAAMDKVVCASALWLFLVMENKVVATIATADW
jgi:hypothetical protein